MKPKDEKDIRTVVREHYGNIANKVAEDSRQSSGCGCQSSSCCSSTAIEDKMASINYNASDLDNLPESVTDASLGCGNPTAIAELKPGEVVLDLGSGGGIDCFLASKQVGPSGRVIGLDMTPKMIDLARRNAKKMGVTNVEFQYGYMEDIPLPDSSVDSIISNCVINLSPDKDAVFHEAIRVLKPGGRLNVSDIVLHGELPQGLLEKAEAWAGCISGALQEDDYLEKMKQAGFSDIRVIKRSFYTLSSMEEIGTIGQELASAGINLEDLDQKIASITVRAVK
jgi:arsenite methyltransferase